MFRRLIEYYSLPCRCPSRRRTWWRPWWTWCQEGWSSQSHPRASPSPWSLCRQGTHTVEQSRSTHTVEQSRPESLLTLSYLPRHRAKSTSSSPATLSLESLSTARSAFRSSSPQPTLISPLRRSSTASGTRSVQSWPLVFLEVSTTFTSLPERRFSTSEPPLALLSRTLLTLLDLCVVGSRDLSVAPSLTRFNSREQEGTVYAVEFSHRSGRDLINMAKKRTNVIRELLLGSSWRSITNFVPAHAQPSLRMPVTLTSTAC